jgi:hypothetical protein
MSEKRMLIIDAEVAKKVEENRGSMDQSDFIAFLIDSKLKGDAKQCDPAKQEYATREDFIQFQQGIKELLRNFMEFFLSYGLELSEQPDDSAMKELNKQLKTFVSKVKPPTG